MQGSAVEQRGKIMREGRNNQLFLFSIGSVALRISPVVWVRLTGAGFDTLGFFLQEVG